MLGAMERTVGAILGCAVALVGLFAAVGIDSSRVPRGLWAMAFVVGVAIAVGWTLARLPRQGGLFSVVRGGLYSAMAFALPVAGLLLLDSFTHASGPTPSNALEWLSLPAGLGWAWVVTLTFALPFGLLWAMLARLAPVERRA